MNSVPQSLDALQDFLDAHGGDPRRWPSGFAEALASRFQADATARAMLARAARLDALVESSIDPAPDFSAEAVIERAQRTAQISSIAARRDAQQDARRGVTLRNQLRPVLALAASLFLGFLVGASGWMPGGRPMLVLDGAEIVALAAESFSLEETP